MKKIFLFCAAVLASVSMWADPTHTSPATVTVANRVFLDLQNTPSNVTVSTDNYSNYGPGYFISNKTADLSKSWWSFSGTFKSTSGGYSNVEGSVGFHTVGSSSSDEFYQILQLREGDSRMTQMDFYVTGTTSIGFQWKNAGTSGKYLTFTIYEMDVTGATATDLSTPAATVQGSTTSNSDQYAAAGNLSGAKYYHIVVTPVNTSNINFYGLTFKHAPAASYTITYNANGGSGEMENSTNTVSACTFTAQDGYKFSSWNTEADGSGDSYKAGDNVSDNIELYAQWVEDVPDPTVTFNDGTYIIGNKALNMAEKFTSNSTGAVTYSLKEATENASITAAGLFSATVAGEYIVVASQAAVPATYAAISAEATVIVMDYEQSDTYVWKKDAKYTGCVTNPNADAPAALYTDITYEGFTGMGRAATANTECILTFSIKGAYSADHRIKNICTYGKLEEPLGGQISWDGGTNWEDLAAYTEGKKEFEAPAGTHATSFKIKFMGVSTSSGGLWWRNALVTLDTPFDISIDGEIANGSVAANVVKAYVGDEVTVSNTPADGYILAAYDVYKTGDATTKVTVTEGKFTMPDYAVTVSATFEEDSASALDNTEAEVKAVKFFKDGQLLIEKNGKIYNIIGAELR